MKKLAFGLMRLPLTDKDDYSKVDMDTTRAMIDRYLSQGFTYFDTAYVYHGGMSESVFGQLVAQRYPRDSFEITTKMPIFMINDAQEYPKIFAEQLERCKVEYFDNYLLHSLGKATYENVQKMHGFEFISRMKSDGKIKKIGFSYHDDASTLDHILTDHPETELVQLQLNYIDWEDAGIQSKACYDVCVAHGVEVMVMEPLKGGALANLPEKAEELLKKHSPDMSAASWGIRFAASLENVKGVLSGMSTPEQLEDNMSYMTDFKPLTPDEYAVIDDVVGIIRASIAIPCTACKYCIDGCPENIAIPEYFALFNNQKQFGKLATHTVTFSNIALKRGKPSDCIECGQCEEHCPQHLPIIDNLKLVKDVFED